jgi:hypothetical protein
MYATRHDAHNTKYGFNKRYDIIIPDSMTFVNRFHKNILFLFKILVKTAQRSGLQSTEKNNAEEFFSGTVIFHYGLVFNIANALSCDSATV